ncbi:DUF1801 domain-containing protein [Aestuariivirga litoralis]|uniref:DUF1801 domain-containing protein n=1 Tax=Aestuariivirga litoralis TaxID=2650924 RepID=UPI0018C4ACC6|nr:DUF1801 domain-containing protein [Aestuariivirga litoralis]MBG1231224.1 DUF1801 domain-containing protein [Aestuariivirga litoralis]
MSASLLTQTVKPYSKGVQARLKEVRALIVETARQTDGVGKLLEALRWGQFSFLTPETGSGSTIRIDGRRDDEGKLAIYFHCQSGLVNEFKQHYPKTFTFEGDRALVFDASLPLPRAELSHCIALALTHHLRKKQKNTKETRNGPTSHHHRH